MTRIFANEFALWCSLANIVAILAVGALPSLIWLDLIRSDKAVSGYEPGHDYNPRQLWRMHRLTFPKSRKRFLLCISFGIVFVAQITNTLMVANDHMDNKLLHLISRGR
jgi:hypothetical protein